MNLDLRLPMGLMFLIVGAMMSIFGIFTWGSPIYEKSMGMNINLVWGLIMFVFGTTMFLLGRRGQRLAKLEPSEPLDESRRPLGH
jgi:predicted MFS family arabinose efflux permease